VRRASTGIRSCPNKLVSCTAFVKSGGLFPVDIFIKFLFLETRKLYALEHDLAIGILPGDLGESPKGKTTYR